ncbi:MAG: DUF2442 domain-containing protein [Planctomycetes bacterium]|nr:DUF2442 domain-containing protein [Planctomycetota bacterium]MBL7037140.1 DUF2442 domain-containing protein [Pirellulaceae bacterium]
MIRVVEVTAVSESKLRLRYSDGVEGVVDLSHLAGKGVFRVWDHPGVFEGVSIGSGGEIRWGDDVDICADALYMELTGKSPDEVFPNLKRAGVNA